MTTDSVLHVVFLYGVGKLDLLTLDAIPMAEKCFLTLSSDSYEQIQQGEGGAESLGHFQLAATARQRSLPEKQAWVTQ